MLTAKKAAASCTCLAARRSVGNGSVGMAQSSAAWRRKEAAVRVSNGMPGKKGGGCMCGREGPRASIEWRRSRAVSFNDDRSRDFGGAQSLSEVPRPRSAQLHTAESKMFGSMACRRARCWAGMGWPPSSPYFDARCEGGGGLIDLEKDEKLRIMTGARVGVGENRRGGRAQRACRRWRDGGTGIRESAFLLHITTPWPVCARGPLAFSSAERTHALDNIRTSDGDRHEQRRARIDIEGARSPRLIARGPEDHSRRLGARSRARHAENK